MTKLNKAHVRNYMESCAHEHRDPRTGEYNATQMAEDAAQHFNCYDGDAPDETLFDLAAAVAEELYNLEGE